MSASRWILLPRRYFLSIGVGMFLLVAAIAAGLVCGEEPLSIWGLIFGEARLRDRDIFVMARLPRVLLAASVGGLLAASGAAFQAVLRNPLADPFVLGAAGGAAFSVVCASVAADGELDWIGRIVVSIAGAAAALLLVFGSTLPHGRRNQHALILAGVLVNAFFGAAILIVIAVLDPIGAHGAVLWMMGSLGTFPSLDAGAVASIALGGVTVGLALLARTSNALSADEEGALLLAAHTVSAKWLLLSIGTLAAGVAVGTAGPIGFVGLIVPHCVRALAGSDHRLVFPLCVLAGHARGPRRHSCSHACGAASAPRWRLHCGARVPFFLWILRSPVRKRGLGP